MHKHHHPRNPAKTMVIGLMVVAFGLLYMLKNMQVIDQQTWRVIFSWPMLLVAVGVINLAERKISWGLLFLAVGGAFLVDRYYDLPFNLFTFFWPVIIIIVGLVMIFSGSTCPLISRMRRIKTKIVGTDGDVIEDAAVFGGSERIIHSNNFKGGEIIAVFGGSKMDLTQCQLAPGVNKIELVAVFGGTTLIVPNDWNVKMEIVSIFGGFADKRHNLNVDYNKTLIIEGVAIFGGGELKSY